MHHTASVPPTMHPPVSLVRDVVFFFFNDTATTEIYTLSLHDALPIYARVARARCRARRRVPGRGSSAAPGAKRRERSGSEKHTAEIQAQSNIGCRLLPEKKKPGALVFVSQTRHNT